jgi:hypothetical protein
VGCCGAGDIPELVLAPDRGMHVSHISSFCITVLDAKCINVRMSVLLDKGDTEPNMVLCSIYEKNLFGHFIVFLTKGQAYVLCCTLHSNL